MPKRTKKDKRPVAKIDFKPYGAAIKAGRTKQKESRNNKNYCTCRQADQSEGNCISKKIKNGSDKIMHGNLSPFNKIVCERRNTPKGAQLRRL